MPSPQQSVGLGAGFQGAGFGLELLLGILASRVLAASVQPHPQAQTASKFFIGQTGESREELALVNRACDRNAPGQYTIQASMWTQAVPGTQY
ncbi:MAG TPA: hypothetical protein VEK33_14395 [Terriglobales bacterium]|nr:hypothetical protein [Terriglobales bacterium]